MKQVVKMLVVLLATASCLTSDTTLSSRPMGSPMVSSVKLQVPSYSTNSFVYVGTTPMPRYSVFPNWGSTACILRKG